MAFHNWSDAIAFAMGAAFVNVAGFTRRYRVYRDRADLVWRVEVSA